MIRRQPEVQHFYGGNLAIVLVQFCMRIRHIDVIGSSTALRAKPFPNNGIPSDDRVFHCGEGESAKVLTSKFGAVDHSCVGRGRYSGDHPRRMLLLPITSNTDKRRVAPRSCRIGFAML